MRVIEWLKRLLAYLGDLTPGDSPMSLAAEVD